MPVDDATLERLAAESEIGTLLRRYARGIDRFDVELVRSCYHPDAIDEHGSYSGGVDGFCDWLDEALARFESIMHFTGPPLIELDGDVAWVESYCLSLARLAAADGEPPRDRQQIIRYCDRFERRQGAWKIAHRVTVWGPSRIDPVLAQEALSDAYHRDRRDRTDFAYRR